MRAKEALRIIDFLLIHEEEPTYINFLNYCREVIRKNAAAEEMEIKRNQWPHCSICKKPYNFVTVQRDLRQLKRICGCEGGMPVMLPRPEEAKWGALNGIEI